MKIRKILIANRGEIAVRVMRTASEMGIRTVAVYSDADAHAMHVRMADEAVALGPADPRQSYLDIEKVVAAALSTGADAVHPGYGFLSERPEFVEACAAAGITFIGPPASAMRRLGSKIEAKSLAVEAQVPIVPGFFDAAASTEVLREAAAKIGYPVMLKASAGGGGRGMRVVSGDDEFLDQLATASDEALRAFGDGTMMVEKLVDRPRHVEVQFLADDHGNVATLFERECSLQRRHQKLIEEAPSPYVGIEAAWRDVLSGSVRRLAAAAGYRNAGTAEFILDTASGEFYFLEVNARLQVEHPVTESITGLDLVREQIMVAQGEPLSIDARQVAGDRTVIRGHAIEARVVAEDPARNFLPSAGPILAWVEPQGPGIRVDTGYGPGGEVPGSYDSLIAKVIASGSTRSEAIDRLKRALRDFHVLGIRTNIGYLLDILAHPDFHAGTVDTGWLGANMAEWTPGPIPAEIGAIASAASAPVTGSASTRLELGAWALGDGFRNARG